MSVPAPRTVRVEGLPTGTTVGLPGGIQVVVNDGYFEWSSTESDKYSLEIHNFPHQMEIVDADFTNV